MKNSILSLIIFFLSATYSIGQITINTSHMPNAGDSARYSISALDTAILFGFNRSGANVEWNFSSLVPLRQRVDNYVASANTPYASDVTNRVGLKIADTLSQLGFSIYDVYDFFRNTSTAYAKDYRGASAPTGLSFPFPTTLNIAPAYSDDDEVYQFPLSYLKRDSSTFVFAYTNSLVGAYYGSDGYRINDVDAWGRLITPYDTFNTIKVVTDIVAFDSVSFNQINFGINSHQRQYKWLSQDLKTPVLIISGNVVAGIFIPSGVQYRDTVRNVPSVYSPLALFRASPTNAEVYDTVSFINNSVSALPLRYQWNFYPNNVQFINGSSALSPAPTVLFTDSGDYDVELIVRNAQGRDTLRRNSYISITGSANSIAEREQKKESFQLYPNPIRAGEALRLSHVSSQIDEISIFSLDGRRIHSFELKNAGDIIYLPTQNLARGQYLIGAFSEGKKLQTSKLFIQ